MALLKVILSQVLLAAHRLGRRRRRNQRKNDNKIPLKKRDLLLNVICFYFYDHKLVG